MLRYSDGVNTTTVNTNQSSLSISVSPNTTTTYSLIDLTDGSGDNGTVAGTATLTVNHAPTFTQNLYPATVTACAGDNVVLTVQVNGTNLSYQWRKDGQPITNNLSATTNTLNIPTFNSGAVGNYDVWVSGDCTSGLSSNVQYVSMAQPIQITSSFDNSSLTICQGAPLVLSIHANGTNVRYQWCLSGRNITNNNTAQSSTYYDSSITASDAGVYDVVMSSPCNTTGIVSTYKSVYLSQSIAISEQPIGQSACLGGGADFMVNTYGSNPMFQWRKNGVAIMNNGSARTSHLMLTNISSSDSAWYDVVVNNSCEGESVTSSTAKLTLYPSLVIHAQPYSTWACMSSDVQLRVEATGYSPTYQWRFNGKPIYDNATAREAILRLTKVGTSAQGVYEVTVYDVCSQWTSASFTLHLATPITIINHLNDQQVCEGTNVQAQVQTSGSVSSYQWLKNGIILPGQTSSRLRLTNVSIEDNAWYMSVIRGDTTCSATADSTNSFQLTVLEQVAITMQPHNAYATIGGFASFRVDAIGATDTYDLVPSYQWYRNGSAMIDNANIHGSNSAQLILDNITASDNGASFSVMVHGPCGDLSSTTASIIVSSIVVSSQITSRQVCQGSATTLNYAAHSDQFREFEYQWFKNQNAIAGATDSTLTISRIQASDSGTYYLRVILDGSMTVYSARAVVSVLASPTFDTLAQLTTLRSCSNSALTLNSQVTTGSNLEYQWMLNGFVINGATSAQYSLSSATIINDGLYSVTVMNACSTIHREVAQLIVLTRTTIETHPALHTIVMDGQLLQLSVQATGDQLLYQWSFNGIEIAAATNSSYMKTVSMSDSGNYSVMINGSCGQMNSNIAAVTISSISAVHETSQQDGWTLSTCSPNPTNSTSSFNFTSTQASRVHVSLSDVQGRNIAVITDANYEAGTFTLNIDANALQLSNGMYSITLISSDGHALHQNVVVLR